MVRYAFSVVLLALCTTVQAAPPGGLKFKTVDPRTALCHTPLVVEKFSAPAGANPGVVVCAVEMPDGPVHVAIDSRGNNGPQAVALDFTGTGEFKQPVTSRINAIQRGANFHGEMAPVTVKVQRNGQSFMVGVMGSVYRSGDKQSVDLQMGVMLESKCTFGERSLVVEVIDGDQNLRFGDKTELQGRKFKIGDTLIIRGAPGSGAPGGGAQPIKVLFGQPVFVDGKWYDLTISDDFELAAAPLELETGQIQVAHGDWSAILVGEKYVIGVGGDARPINVPVDTYRVTRYEERVGPALISCQGQSDRAIAITAGKLEKLELGSPIAGVPVIFQKGDSVTIGAKLVDASGLAVSELRLPSGRRPPPPIVAIFDATGRQLYMATLEYG
ncbi:MAG: hypothetical protein WD042_10210 [Phycisphaeraceae bacterium]